MTINTYLQMATNMLIKCAVLQQLARIAGKESQKRFWLMGAALLIVVQNCICLSPPSYFLPDPS